VCGTPVSVDIDESLDSLSEPCRICIYRVVEEALNNAGKHSHAQHIEVSVKHDDHLVSITVCDDGVGFGPSPGSNGGLGLIGMNERLRQLGGSIAIDSRPGAGTAISAQIPLDGNARYEPNPDSIGG
jgi:signal transduction histidine kinase